jgi:putative spermidine/putrescine transport system ATP-binding protein
LVFGPDVILMDEPLGALDKQLREQLQIEIKQIQRHLGVTVVYVTHDQSEALTLSDRIALFAQGSIRQIGTPQDLYEHPVSAFVAQFIGQNNRIEGIAEEFESDRCVVRLTAGTVLRARLAGSVERGERVTAWVRPEHIELVHVAANGANVLNGSIQEVLYQGDHLRVRVALAAGAEVIAKCARGKAEQLRRGDSAAVAFSPEHCVAFAEQPAGALS